MGYSLQFSGELLRCNCLLLLLSNSCHSHVALPLSALHLPPGNLSGVNRNYTNTAIFYFFCLFLTSWKSLWSEIGCHVSHSENRETRIAQCKNQLLLVLTTENLGDFKIKACLNDGGNMNQCFHFASMPLDRWSLIVPGRCIVTPIVATIQPACGSDLANKTMPPKCHHSTWCLIQFCLILFCVPLTISR